MSTRALTVVGALSFAVLGCSEDTELPSGPTQASAAKVEAAVASNTWVVRRDMWGNQVGSYAAAVVPNAAGQSILYVIGGTNANGASLSKVMAYNASTNAWSAKAPLPIPLFQTNGAGVIDGKIYVSGGQTRERNFRAELFVYHPAGNTWTRKRDMPTQGFRGVTGVIDGKLYVLTDCDQEDCFDFVSQAFYRYDPSTDTWVTLPRPTNTYHWGVGGVIGGKLYAAASGGLEAYDPATNRWTAKASMAAPRSLGTGAALGGKLYFLGGLRNGSAVRTTSVYDPVTNTWANKAPMPDAHLFFAAARVVVDGKARLAVVAGSRPGNNLQYIP